VLSVTTTAAFFIVEKSTVCGIPVFLAIFFALYIKSNSLSERKFQCDSVILVRNFFNHFFLDLVIFIYTSGTRFPFPFGLSKFALLEIYFSLQREVVV
jgi:hypothetical protein